MLDRIDLVRPALHSYRRRETPNLSSAERLQQTIWPSLAVSPASPCLATNHAVVPQVNHLVLGLTYSHDTL